MTDVTKDWLDNALAPLKYCLVNNSATNLCDGCKEHFAQAKQAITDKLREARIEELKYWQWKTDGHIELSGKEVDDRIAELKGKP